ncbi:MAG TPA: thioredoxin family protein [Candidatus Lumbricidophila sp.]|nr:thioredoxin family protein [Candidatus Lumbricidophila sp.]
MQWTIALLAVVGVLIIATGLGLVIRARSGRTVRLGDTAVCPTSAHPLERYGVSPEPGASVTLVQYSTEFCSACPGTARVLGGVARDYAGVRHVEVDLTKHPSLAQELRISQTPTTLVVDAHGTAVARVGGAPRVEQLRALLDSLVRNDLVNA